MPHIITAVIGASAVVARVANAAGCPAPTELKFGLQIAPLGDEQIDRLTALNPGEYFTGFNYLSEGLANALLVAAGTETLLYIETEYHGGTGSQGAAVLVAGKIETRTAYSVGQYIPPHEYPINQALRALGVEACAGQDEFDTIGLGRFRSLTSLGLK